MWTLWNFLNDSRFYPVEVNHGFVDPGEKGDGMIKIDGTTYAIENSDVLIDSFVDKLSEV